MFPTLSAVALLTLLFASGAAAEEVRRDIHKEFPVTRGMTLDLDHGDGKVVVSPWDRDVLDIEVSYHVTFTRAGVGPEMDFTLEAEAGERVIHVAGKETGYPFTGFTTFQEESYLYRIRAPRYLVLDLAGEDGDVLVEGWRSDVTIRVEDGDVNIDDMEGRLEVLGEDGDVRVTGSRLTRARVAMEDGHVRILHGSGDVTVSTEDGSVDIGDVPAADIDVRTEDRDVGIDLTPGKRLSLRVETQDGSVRIALPAGASAAYRIRTGDGKITLDLPGTHRVEDNEAVGRLGNGDGTLVVRTDDGPIAVSQPR
jgi:hypothetical protein